MTPPLKTWCLSRRLACKTVPAVPGFWAMGLSDEVAG